jgi:hypothetical protein
MPLGKIVKAGMEAKRLYDADKNKPKQMVSDPQIPVPGRKRNPPPQPTNQSKANVAADALRIPGRDVVRGAMRKRQQQLDEL